MQLEKLIAFIRCRVIKHKVTSDKSVLERVMYDSTSAKHLRMFQNSFNSPGRNK